MKIVVHCFALVGEINPEGFSFTYKEWDVSIRNFPVLEKKGLILQITRVLSKEEVDEYRVKLSESPSASETLAKRSLPYKHALTEIGQIVEGLFSAFYFNAPPKFESYKPTVNLYGESEEEIREIEDGLVSRGFGILDTKGTGKYDLNEGIKDYIEGISVHLPAFTFYAQGLRSLRDNDHELAFFLFFRIIEGYFSNGKKDIEKALHRSASELINYLPYEEDLVNSTKDILLNMKIPSKSKDNFNGLLSDLVNIRHKMTHFSVKNAELYHSPTIKFLLHTVNYYLCQACFNLLRNNIANVEIDEV